MGYGGWGGFLRLAEMLVLKRQAMGTVGGYGGHCDGRRGMEKLLGPGVGVPELVAMLVRGGKDCLL